jgi:hypothetical protein
MLIFIVEGLQLIHTLAGPRRRQPMGCSTDLYWEQRMEKTGRAQRRERNIRENMLRRLRRIEEGKFYSHFSVIADIPESPTTGGYFVGH